MQCSELGSLTDPDISAICDNVCETIETIPQTLFVNTTDACEAEFVHDKII